MEIILLLLRTLTSIGVIYYDIQRTYP